MDLPVHVFVCSSAMCNISGAPAWIFNETHRNDKSSHGVQAFPLPVIMIGMLVVGGLQVRTETLINILSYPAGLTDVEFSAHTQRFFALQTYFKDISLCHTGFSTILNPNPLARNRGWCT